MSWDKDECEAGALRSHAEAVGQERTVSTLDMFLSGEIRQHIPKPPWRVRILETPKEFMVTWTGDYLDSRWYVEPINENDRVEGAITYWIYDPISWVLAVGPT